MSTSNAIPEPYAHGYLYGGTSYALVDAPYPDDLQAAARAGTLKPNDDTWQNPRRILRPAASLDRGRPRDLDARARRRQGSQC